MSRLVIPIRDDPAMANAGEPGDGYLTRVAKYVPTEIVAGYIFLNGTASGLPNAWVIFGLTGSFVLCLALTPLYLRKMAKPGQPKRLHIAVSMLAFVVWAYAAAGSGGVFGVGGLNWYHEALAAMLIAAFSLISGFLRPTPGQP